MEDTLHNKTKISGFLAHRLFLQIERKRPIHSFNTMLTGRESNVSISFEPGFDEVRQDNLISEWLQVVKNRFRKITYVKREKDGSVQFTRQLYANKAQTERFSKRSSTEFQKELAKLGEGNLHLENGDHLFMRSALNKKEEKEETLLERSGDHIFEIDPAESDQHVYGVAFLLDYTLRWNSRLENFSGSVQKEVPLIFSSFQFFCSTPMLMLTIGLLAYMICWQIVGIVRYGNMAADVYNNAGVLAAVLLGTYVVKGSWGVATFEKAAQMYVVDVASKLKNVSSAREPGSARMSEVGVEMRSNEEDNVPMYTESVRSDEMPKAACATVPIDGSGDKSDDNSKDESIPRTFGTKCHSFLSALAADTFLSLKDVVREHTATGRKVRANGLTEGKGFMEVLDVATEYLHLMSTNVNGFKARIYSTLLLRVAYIVLPVFLTYWIIGCWVDIDSCRRHGHHGFKSSNHYCNSRNFHAAYTLGFTIRWLSTLLGVLNIAVSFSILMYSTDVANALSKYWLHRFRVLRRISAQQLDKDRDKDKQAPNGDKRAIELETIQPLIERDAYERYLFTHTYFTEASNQWSLYLFVCLAATFALCLECYLTLIYLYAKYQRVDVNYITLCVLNAFFFTLVFCCMAYANSAVEKVHDGFVYAGSNDYALMGGRAAWLEYVDKAPIYWYIFGFAIKRSEVISYIGGLVSAAVAGVIMSVIVADSR